MYTKSNVSDEWHIFSICAVVDDKEIHIGAGEHWGRKGGPLVYDIREHRPQGEGDRWFWDVYLDDGGTIHRFFNVARVEYWRGGLDGDTPNKPPRAPCVGDTVLVRADPFYATVKSISEDGVIMVFSRDDERIYGVLASEIIEIEEGSCSQS